MDVRIVNSLLGCYMEFVASFDRGILVEIF